MEKFKTLNNSVAEHIVLCACRGKVRFCAYSLYNHYKANTFNDVSFKHLFIAVCNLIGPVFFESIIDDDTIDYCVRDFIFHYNRLRHFI